MGRQKSFYKSVPFTVRASPYALAYLDALRETGLFGATNSEVAGALLEQAIVRLRPNLPRLAPLAGIQEKAEERQLAEERKKSRKKSSSSGAG